MTPIYIEHGFQQTNLERLLTEVPWRRTAQTRSECFMSEEPYRYTYGKGRGIRSYESVPFTAGVDDVLKEVNTLLKPNELKVNGCFLNLYTNDRDHLGWHADDFINMDQKQPVVVVSFGANREIWWRKKGEKGEVPFENRRLLIGGNSLFIMPPGMQATHEHRIPKADRPLGPRVSLTFRYFI